MDPCLEIERIAEQNKRASLATKAETKYKEVSNELAEILETDNPEAVGLAMLEQVDEILDGYVQYLLDGASSSRAIDAIAFRVSTENLSTAREYIALKLLKDNIKKLDSTINSYVKGAVMQDAELRKQPTFVTEKLKKPIRELFHEQLNSKLADAYNILEKAGASLVDSQDVFQEIKNLKEQYDEELANPYVVPYTRDGETTLVETDPFLADLVNYRYTAGTKPDGALGAIGSVMISINRVARTFETVFNPSSIRNQYFRDPANGLIVGGAYEFTGAVDRHLQDEFGAQLLEHIKNTEPENWKAIQAIADERGVSVESVATEVILARGSANSATLSDVMRTPIERGETAPNRTFWGQSIKKTKSAISKVIDKLSAPAEKVGDVREVYVRKNVAANNILKSLRAGHTVEEALTIGRFSAANATTNYGRMLVHTENFRRTVNYYGAAVNGFKSFWRMFELDPIGISVRLNCGILIPIIAATIFSLSNEKSRKVYKSLREYEKEGKLVIVIDGTIYNIPIPQEMNAITSMTRHAVESLFEGSRHNFWELAMNDILGFGPVDFSDMVDIDMNRFADDPTFLERLGGQGLSMVNQFAPVAIKSIIEATFNIDTYTGNPIDTSYKQFDDEGNLIVVNPQSTGKFAESLGNLTGWSAPIISHILKNMLGQVGVDILNTVSGGQSPMELASGVVENLMSTEGSNYDRIDQEWQANVASLWREKEQLLVEYNKYNEEINKTSDPDKQAKLRTERQNLIDPFLKKVQTAVKKLKEQYPGSYDRYRFASVVSLLNFDTGTTAGDTASQRAASLQNYYDNLNRSYQWMQSLGIETTDSDSLLGYLTRNSSGETVVKWNTPTSILAARNAYYGKGEKNIAEIELLLDTAGIKRSDMFGDAYNQAKVAGKTAFKQYKANWNARVVKAVAPYIREMGIDSVLENSATRDFLDNYIFVDNPYQTKQYLYKIFGGQ